MFLRSSTSETWGFLATYLSKVHRIPAGTILNTTSSVLFMVFCKYSADCLIQQKAHRFLNEFQCKDLKETGV